MTLALRIRAVVDAADRFLAQPEIYGRLKGRLLSLNVFAVEIARMLKARQLRRRKATKAVHAASGARSVYGPGPVLVLDGADRAEVPRKAMGFMAMKRLREAKARARRLARR